MQFNIKGVFTMKISRIIVLLIAVCLLIVVALPLISSKMQSYYKAQLDDTNTPEETQSILNKKAFWSDLGEGHVAFCVCLIFVGLSLIIILCYHIKKRSNNTILKQTNDSNESSEDIREYNMKNIKDVANQLKPFFLANGFFRKGNAFMKIENCFIFFICFHHGYALTPEFYVIPLYYPYSMKTVPFGSEFSEYKKLQVKFDDYIQVDERYIAYMVNKDEKSMDFDKWIHDVEKFCEKQIFPLMSRVSSINKMKSFLDMGFYTARGEWSNMTLVDYHTLKAYTQFVMGEYDAMQSTIQEGIRAIDDWRASDSSQDQWKHTLQILNENKNLSEQEKMEWLNDIVSNTLKIWLGKNWETVIKNRLALPIDFTNC